MPIEQFGSDVLIEQRFAPVKPVPRKQPDGEISLTKTGKVITDNVFNVDQDGNMVFAWVVYQREAVVDGTHPWTGELTSETYVWMPVGEYQTVEEARAAAQQLAGV